MSSAQTHNAGPSKVSKSKRILSDSEDTSERETSRVREAKRPRHADSLIDIDQKRTTMDKDKKKRRKRKRKQSIVQSQNVLLGAGGALNAVTAQAAGHSRTRSEPPTAPRRSVSPRAGLLDVLLPEISRQTSVGLSSVTLGSQSPEVQPKEISVSVSFSASLFSCMNHSSRPTIRARLGPLQILSVRPRAVPPELRISPHS